VWEPGRKILKFESIFRRVWTDGDGLSIFLAKNGVRTGHGPRLKLIARRVAVSIRVPSAQTKNIKFEPSPLSSGGVYPAFSDGSPKYFIEKIGDGSRWCGRVNVSGPP
jgi:hypothetical protein